MSALPRATLGESLRVLGAGVLPALARGLFVPRRGAMKLLTARDADGRAIAVLSGLRSRRDGQGVQLLGGRMIVLWGAEAIREVLDRSAETYASDAGAKAKGMCHFQPDALTLSRGEEWRDRRAFTEHVLAGHDRVHPLAARFVDVAGDEVARLDVGGEIGWPAFAELFDHLTLRVIFGDRYRDRSDITARLEQLMREANRLVGTGGDGERYELLGELERALRNPEPGTLLSRFAAAPQTDVTRVVHQLPHWMFAMRDTLAANAFRALAAVVSDRGVARRVRGELEGADLGTPAGIDSLRYLEGCLEEAMRLWPTTPLLAREVMRDATLCGERVAAGTQVLILNTFNHRDTGQVPDADRFRPERWPDAAGDYRFNHLSHGTQDCPGGPLVRLLGKAVLARLLAGHDLELREPALDISGATPTMLDFFAIRLAAAPVTAPAPSRGANPTSASA